MIEGYLHVLGPFNHFNSPVDFFKGIIMNRTKSRQSAGIFEPEAVYQGDGEIVTATAVDLFCA